MGNNDLKELLNNYETLRSYKNDYPNLCAQISQYINLHIFNHEKIAIWGTGTHTEELLRILDLNNFDVVCYFDNDSSKWGDNYSGRIIYNPSELKRLKIDKVIISSFLSRKEIKKQLITIGNEVKYIDIYDEFKLKHPFYFYGSNCKKIANEVNELLRLSLLYKFDLENIGVKIDIQLNKKLNDDLENENISYDEMKKEFSKKDCSFFYDYLKEKLLNPVETEKNKVIYLAQIPTAWTSFQSVYEEYLKDESVEVLIIQIPFLHENYKEKGQMREYLIKNKIKFIPWYLFDFKINNSDIVFFQNPYDETRPYKFTVDNIATYGAKIVYIPYAFELIKKWPGSQMDYINIISQTSLLKKCWRIFMRSNRSKKMYSQYSSNGDNHMIVTGHPKIDLIVNYGVTREELICSNIKYNIFINKKIILWTPNLGKFGGEEKWVLYSDMLDVIEVFENIIIICRPHPMQLAKLKDKKISDDHNFEKFKYRIMNLKNVILDDDPNYMESFILSDALITCSSSLIFEYLATKKPILYTPQDYKAELNDDGDVVKYLYIGNDEKDIESFFSNVLNEVDEMKERRISSISEFLYSIDGNNGKRIKNYINNYL